MRPDATGKAADVLRCIIDYKRSHDGLSPTLRAIGDATGIASTSSVAYYLRKLGEDGEIVRTYGVVGIEVVGGRWLAPDGVQHEHI